jgi:DNA-directed RNA polymerase subunit RPC12/RpoP
MRVYKCDRCGKLVEQDFLSLVSFPYRGIYRFGRKGHVCSECEKSFDKWFYDAKLAQKKGAKEDAQA